MLKKAKIFVTICLLFSFTQVTPVKAFAAETTSKNQITTQKNYSDIKNYAQKFFNKQNGKGTLSDPIELYNFNNSVQALFFSSNKSGYIIINLSDYSIPEYSTVNSNKFIVNSNKKHIYNGPLSYFEQENDGTVTELQTKENMGDMQNLKTLDIFPKINTKKLLTASSTPNSIANSELAKISSDTKVTTRPYTTKNRLTTCTMDAGSGTCSPTAALMLLKYYDSEYNNFILSNEKKYSDANLERILIPLMGTVIGPTSDPNSGTKPENISPGLNKYLQSRNLSRYTAKYFDSETPLLLPDGYHNYVHIDPDLVKSLINSDNPFILDLNADSWDSIHTKHYGNHSVTAWAYDTISYNNGPEYFHYIEVNDCWGNNSVWIDPIYTSGMNYIKVN